MWQRLARWIFRMAGWKMVGRIPDIDKGVFIAAPHTSNWDGFWFLTYKVAQQVEVSFLAKQSLFWWPLGSLLSAMGAIPIDRHDAAGLVPQLVSAFEEREHLFLALAPEGTRKWKPHWKSGFYRIAKAADVPITLAFIDYRRKEIGIGPTLPRDRTVGEDLAAISEFYVGITGRHPELQGPVTFPPE
jgi:1-acyl-sn-glycerol-3-phosphate acyltransferase